MWHKDILHCPQDGYHLSVRQSTHLILLTGPTCDLYRPLFPGGRINGPIRHWDQDSFHGYLTISGPWQLPWLSRSLSVDHGNFHGYLGILQWTMTASMVTSVYFSEPWQLPWLFRYLSVDHDSFHGFFGIFQWIMATSMVISVSFSRRESVSFPRRCLQYFVVH